MRIAGIDAGLDSTGFAILDTAINDFIVIERIKTTKKKATPSNQHRARYIAGEISQLLMFNSVDVVVIEDIFINPKRPSAIIPVARLRGHIEQAVLDLEYPGLHVLRSTQVKQAVAGKGNSKKEDCFHAIKALYPHSKLLKKVLGPKFIGDGKDKNDDISDACCVAHAYFVNPSVAEFL